MDSPSREASPFVPSARKLWRTRWRASYESPLPYSFSTFRELIEASSRRRGTMAGKTSTSSVESLRIYADRNAEPLIRSRLSCTS